MNKKIKINFSNNQKLPPGYLIEWWESDEHYHFVIENDADFESVCYCDRFMCRQAAWNHYNTWKEF